MTTTASGFTADASGTSAALERYQYLLRTSSPDQIEQAHAQAFAAMSETERREVLRALSTAGEHPTDASASSLARAATRYEMRQPGGLQNLLGRASAMSGSSLAATALASVAAGFVGSAVWDGITGGDGLGGRPGLLSRLFGGGQHGGFGLGGLGGFGGGQNGFGGFGGFGEGPGGPGGFGGGGFGGGPGGPGGGPGF